MYLAYLHPNIVCSSLGSFWASASTGFQRAGSFIDCTYPRVQLFRRQKQIETFQAKPQQALSVGAGPGLV